MKGWFLSVLLTFSVFGLCLPKLPPRIDSCAASVRLPSHGAAATVIWTGPGKSFLLGCAHAYRYDPDTDEDWVHRHMTFDLPPVPARDSPCAAGSVLLAIEFDVDLSLVQLDAGPLPVVAPIAAPGHHAKRLANCGHEVHQVELKAAILYTRERPIHGDSGSGLIDMDSGELCGVCYGFETKPGGRGIYVSLEAITAFMARHPNLLPEAKGK